MPRKLIRHGTNTGYRAELVTGEPCQRCHNAHLVYQTQYSKENRAKGIKYRGDQVIDHLYASGSGSNPSRPAYSVGTASRRTTGDPGPVAEPSGSGPSGPAQAPSRPSLSERIKSLTIGNDSENESGNEYVADQDYPDYITPDSVDPDPDPDGEESGYQSIPDDSAEYIINAAGMAKIEDSLGTYLSIFGITMEMVDPYCGPILAENMDNIVRHWAKVIAKYPKAAEIFMDGKGGVLMAWISAIQATWPFLYAMYEHHFAKTVQVSGGQIYRSNGKGPASARMPDPTMPPMQDQFNYTAG